MPILRCPKCRSQLRFSGSEATVTCAACGQMCQVPDYPFQARASFPSNGGSGSPPSLSISRKSAPVRVQGADDYATIFTATKHYLVSIRLGDLENRLARTTFLRIHRSHLINLEHVTAIEPCDAIRLKAVMKSGIEIVASRSGSKRLRELTL